MKEDLHFEEIAPDVFLTGTGSPTTQYIQGSTSAIPNFQDLMRRLPGTHIISKHPFHNERGYPENWEEEVADINLDIAEKNNVDRIVGHSRGCIVGLDLIQQHAYPAKEMVFLHPPFQQAKMAFLKRKPCPEQDTYGDFATYFMSHLCPEMTNDDDNDKEFWDFIKDHWEEYASSKKTLNHIMMNEVKGIDFTDVQRRVISLMENIGTRMLIIAGDRDPYHMEVKALSEHMQILPGVGHYAHASRAFNVAMMISEFSRKNQERENPVQKTPHIALPVEADTASVEEESYGF